MGVSVKGRDRDREVTAIPGAALSPKWRRSMVRSACLIYSDPNEDGFKQGETFPAGALASA